MNTAPGLSSPAAARSGEASVAPGATTLPPPAWQPAQLRVNMAAGSDGEAAAGTASAASAARAGEANARTREAAAAQAAAGTEGRRFVGRGDGGAATREAGGAKAIAGPAPVTARWEGMCAEEGVREVLARE